MAELYEVTVEYNSWTKNWKDKVKVLIDLEEKPKSFVGKHRRINKSDLNRMIDYLGGKKIIVDSEDKIQSARESIYNYFKADLEHSINSKQTMLDKLNAFDIKSKIKFE
jgi:hypothetical protein